MRDLDWLGRLLVAGALHWTVLRGLTIIFSDSPWYFLPVIYCVVGPVVLSIFFSRCSPLRRNLEAAYIQGVTLGFFVLTIFLWQLSQILVLGVVLAHSAYMFHELGISGKTEKLGLRVTEPGTFAVFRAGYKLT